MAHATHTLTRGAYTSIASADDTVNVQLPVVPFRLGNVDSVELITAISAPTVPTDLGAPRPEATVLESSPDQFVTVTNWTIPTGESLWARWIGRKNYAAATDLYVVTF